MKLCLTEFYLYFIILYNTTGLSDLKVIDHFQRSSLYILMLALKWKLHAFSTECFYVLRIMFKIKKLLFFEPALTSYFS